ncbi:MAG TPA: sigma-70 family RNA polymerase sigma factor [Abditibacteriaceae bacterium]
MARNETELARRIGQGDRRAYEEFVDAFGARVHSLVRHYIADATDAEDVTQEIFIDLFRCAGTFRGESSLSTWVYRVAFNHCMKHLKRGLPASESLEESHEVADASPDPQQWAARRELSNQVQQAVGTLSPLHRDVVILHEMHGLTYGECALVLGIPIGTVKSRLSNAFRTLRASLGGYVLGETDAHPGALGEAA